MTLGYDGRLFILAFDHRGSLQRRLFGVAGEPDAAQTARIADAKHVVFEGMALAAERGVDPEAVGVLVDEQFGGDIPRDAKARGMKLAMPVERSGQEVFDFEYGEDFGAHIEAHDPDLAKVLVRWNPEGDAQLNAVQGERPDAVDGRIAGVLLDAVLVLDQEGDVLAPHRRQTERARLLLEDGPLRVVAALGIGPPNLDLDLQPVELGRRDVTPDDGELAPCGHGWLLSSARSAWCCGSSGRR
jgi:hypothetical protein